MVEEQKLTSFMRGYEEKEDWTFSTADTKYMTHGFHPYPARMIPQVARKLIDTFVVDPNMDVCIDPYCGSGTVLVESKLKGITSIGIDTNPLAVLISKVKTVPLPEEILLNTKRHLLTKIRNERLRDPVVQIPTIKNLEYWFKPEVSRVLKIIKDKIQEIENNDVCDFFQVCFSLTVRKVSNTRPGEFKLFRIPNEKLKYYKPNVEQIFFEIVNNNIKKMRQFNEIIERNNYRSIRSIIIKGDTRKLTNLRPDIIHEGCATLLITSPPYGDSHTTVAYGQFSRYSSAWLGFNEEEIWKVDSVALGGKLFKETTDLESPTLSQILDQISKSDEHRARETYAFFRDIDECFNQITRIMKRDKSHICYVLGNRTVKRVRIPADMILVELGKKYGFKHITTKHREIPSKHMPSINAPENITSLSGETMSKENIVIWEC